MATTTSSIEFMLIVRHAIDTEEAYRRVQDAMTPWASSVLDVLRVPEGVIIVKLSHQICVKTWSDILERIRRIDLIDHTKTSPPALIDP